MHSGLKLSNTEVNSDRLINDEASPAAWLRDTSIELKRCVMSGDTGQDLFQRPICEAGLSRCPFDLLCKTCLSESDVCCSMAVRFLA